MEWKECQEWLGHSNTVGDVIVCIAFNKNQLRQRLFPPPYTINWLIFRKTHNLFCIQLSCLSIYLSIYPSVFYYIYLSHQQQHPSIGLSNIIQDMRICNSYSTNGGVNDMLCTLDASTFNHHVTVYTQSWRMPNATNNKMTHTIKSPTCKGKHSVSAKVNLNGWTTCETTAKNFDNFVSAR